MIEHLFHLLHTAGHTKVIVIGAVVLLALYFLRPRNDEQKIRRLFKIPEDYTVLSHDLGDGAEGKTLRRDGLIGKPDAAFISRQQRNVIVGEFKSRRYKRRVKPYERYQCNLYGGMLQSMYPGYRIELRLAFSDRLVRFPFDPRLYAALRALVPELRRSKEAGEPLNKTPLDHR